MKIDLLKPGVWEQACDELRTHFNLPEKAQVKIYNGIAHALFEIGQALAAMVPAKQGLAVVEHTGPYFEPLVLYFSRLAYHIHLQTSAVFDNPGEWVKNAINDSAFFLWSEDDPFTGRIYDKGAIENELKDKRVYRVRLSHSAHLRRPHALNLGPFQVELRSLRSDLCVALLGERVRFNDSIAPHLPWPEDLVSLVTSLQKPLIEDPTAIEKFEQSRVAELEPFFAPGISRLCDRAIVYWKDMDSSAALEMLAQELKSALQPAGVESRFESASQCRWDDFHGMKWLHAQGVQPEVVRGLFALDARVISSDLPSKLSQVREKILALQNG